ncbi:MAG: hypothetical protein ABIN13_01490, partial [Mucilaginibacter sp.]
WNQSGAQSKGALVHINMANNGTVIESDYQSSPSGTYFRFSTLSSPLDFGHPVSGNRDFGIYPDPNNPGSYTFYTMGVDRISDWQFAFANSFGSGPGAIFNGADALWTAMQNNMINYINSHGGHAQFYPNHSNKARPDWDLVKDYLEGRKTFEDLKQEMGCY